jgi:succinoglycan biosynthesis transport protein ExoP
MEIFDRPHPSDRSHPSDNSYRSWDAEQVSLREVLAKFWRRKSLIFLCIIVCAGLAFLLTKVMTPAYTGEAQIAIKPPQSGVLVGDRSIPIVAQVAPEMVQTEAFALQSRALASATIIRLHLDRDPEFNLSLRKPTLLAALLDDAQGWAQPMIRSLFEVTEPEVANDGAEGSLDADKSAEMDKPSTGVVDAFMSRLRVTVQQKSNVIQASFKSSQPATAAAVPNTLIKLYLDQRAGEKDQALVQEREQLDKIILPAFREKMEASERELAEYRQKSGLISDRNATVLGQELSETRGQLSIARTRTAEAALRLREAELTSTSPGVASEPLMVQRLREQEVGLQGQLAALKKSSHGPNYPQTLQMEAQLKEFKDGIRRESSDAIGRLKTGLGAAQETEAALSRRVTELTRQFALVSGGDIQLTNLISGADADQKAYERYLARSNELRSNIGHAQADANLLSPADTPLKPSPSLKLVVLAGIVIGAGGGLIWVTLLDGLLKGLRNEKQIEEILGIKCLGLVPKVKKPHRHGVRRRERPSAIRDFTLNTQYVAFGEAIRSAQIKLLSFDRQVESRAILITAALPDEGKSWVAASLALSLAADGWSVALVDCDLNRPSVHRMFDGPRHPGLTDYFAGGVALDEIVHSDPSSGVCYVPIGSTVTRETWRKTFSLMSPLVERLREKYAFVILDSAPVLAVSETILLSQIAQKTILVVKWASTPPAIARHAAIQLLESAGAEVAALLSMVNTKRAARNGDPIASVYKELERYYRR